MAEQEQDSGEKEFEASEQKRRQAREDGNVAQSREANNFAVVLGILCATVVMTTVTGQAVFERFSSLLYHADSISNDAFLAEGRLGRHWLQGTLLRFLPIFGILVACTGLVIILTQSFSFSFKKIKPDVKKLSPAENIKKRYGPRGLLDFARDMAKMLFSALIAAVFLYQLAQNYYGSTALQKGDLAAFTFEQVFRLVLAFGVFQFVLAAIDLPIQWQMHASRLRMTREELKKETKQSEGDPHLKQSRREKASKISRGQMLRNVKDATVVMVNPEHYAVALKWEPESQRAPVCVAKGVDHLAAKIREIALENSIPIYRDPPATRSIYRLVEIDEEIHPEHFAAVAAAIQFVERIRKAQA